MTRPENAYEIRIPVTPDDIDRLGHVNNVVYLRWVQDAAVAHWLAAASPEMQKGLIWVVARHEIDYRHPAMPDDVVLAATWVGAASRRAFERHTEIRRERDGRVLAQARTVWCPISLETGRPTDVDEAVRARFSTPADAVTE
ncbi:MAG TPA: thioesterase family protein [Candidatus Krumholzibacteria bacterium]|nr:thioesterase family protein [Candidatus Krumholzibacteria bacterium]HRX50578.1 thioesterase family protein [Candidatus Krumholzibacteria bacterium]